VKVETWLFGAGALFFAPVGVVYGFVTGWDEAVGVAGLLLTSGLSGLIAMYLYVTAKRIDPRPEDDQHGEVATGAGELGVFAPHSWWPLPLAFSAAVCFAGLAVGWWLFLIGAGLAAIAVVGWVFEFYRGEHAH